MAEAGTELGDLGSTVMGGNTDVREEILVEEDGTPGGVGSAGSLVLPVDTAAGAAIPVCEHVNCAFVVGVGLVPVQHQHDLLVDVTGASESHANATADG
jgi:hypothetical protein